MLRPLSQTPIYFNEAVLATHKTRPSHEQLGPAQPGLQKMAVLKGTPAVCLRLAQSIDFELSCALCCALHARHSSSVLGMYQLFFNTNEQHLLLLLHTTKKAARFSFEASNRHQPPSSRIKSTDGFGFCSPIFVVCTRQDRTRPHPHPPPSREEKTTGHDGGRALSAKDPMLDSILRYHICRSQAFKKKV